MKKTSILTDFIDAAEKWGEILSGGSLGRGKKFKKETLVEPQLFEANIGIIEGWQIVREALSTGIQVELETANDALGKAVLIDDSEKRLSTFLRYFSLDAKIERGGGKDVVQFTGPRLRFDDEVKALGMGARVGRGYAGAYTGMMLV
jgi:hypothetical protein